MYGKTINGQAILTVKDDFFANTNHVPVYRDLTGNYSWTELGSSNKQLATGDGKKEKFAAQLTYLKSGRKLRPLVIFKCAYLPTNNSF